MVSRQNLSGVLSRMERAGHLGNAPDGRDRRSRLITITLSITDTGRQVWVKQAQPKISRYYEQALDGFSVNDSSHMLHYLLKILENMKRIDAAAGTSEEEAEI